MQPHTLTGAEKLTQVEGWDSLSTMEFIAMACKHFGLALSGNQVVGCQTVDELLALLGPMARAIVEAAGYPSDPSQLTRM